MVREYGGGEWWVVCFDLLILDQFCFDLAATSCWTVNDTYLPRLEGLSIITETTSDQKVLI
jgi:hypothetical protein